MDDLDRYADLWGLKAKEYVLLGGPGVMLPFHLPSGTAMIIEDYETAAEVVARIKRAGVPAVDKIPGAPDFERVRREQDDPQQVLDRLLDGYEP
jgi:hypothetical protein